MPDILADFSQASMAQAVEANLFAFFQYLASWPMVELHDREECRFTLSSLPFPLFNSVMRARSDDAGADALIESRIADCRARNVPMLWWTGPSSTPVNLPARLARHGFLLEPAFGMAIDLQSPVAEPPRDATVAIEAVEDAATLTTWSHVLCAAFGAPQRFGDSFAELALAIGLGAGSPFRHFLARVNGQPVATSSLFLGAGVAGVYDVSTLPERRRRGLGGLVTLAAMREARARGYRMAILHSSTSGVGLYGAIGFRDVCAIGQHVWAPDGLQR